VRTRDVQRAVLLAVASLLRRWSDALHRHAGRIEGDANAAAAEPALPGGPPAHWIEHIRRRAPHLLRTLNQGMVARPQTQRPVIRQRSSFDVSKGRGDAANMGLPSEESLGTPASEVRSHQWYARDAERSRLSRDQITPRRPTEEPAAPPLRAKSTGALRFPAPGARSRPIIPHGGASKLANTVPSDATHDDGAFRAPATTSSERHARSLGPSAKGIARPSAILRDSDSAHETSSVPHECEAQDERGTIPTGFRLQPKDASTVAGSGLPIEPSPVRMEYTWRSLESRKSRAAPRSRRLTPSPGTPGEGGGEGIFFATATKDPHPNPLPEYRARGFGSQAGDAPGDPHDLSLMAPECLETNIPADPWPSLPDPASEDVSNLWSAERERSDHERRVAFEQRGIPEGNAAWNA